MTDDAGQIVGIAENGGILSADSAEEEVARAFDMVDDAEAEDDRPTSLAIEVNRGLAAGYVAGGMHLHRHLYLAAGYRRPRELTPEYMKDALTGFVEPGYRTTDGELDSESALHLLIDERYLVMVGPRGTGRYTAALQLLSQLDVTVHNVTVGDDRPHEDQISADVIPRERRSAFLLELPEAPHRVPDDFARQLVAYREGLYDRESFLVVIATAEVWSHAGGYNDRRVLRPGRPDPEQVFVRELDARLQDATAWTLLPQDSRERLLAKAAPSDAKRLARLTAELVASLEPGKIPAEAGSQIIAAYHNWENELAVWFRQKKGVRERLFLVATAVLEGSTADVVLRSAEELGNRLREASPSRGGIGDAGIRELINDIGAHLHADGTVRYLRPAYGSAVLDFLRSDRSDEFQRALWTWAAGLPLRQQRHRDAHAVAVRIAEVMAEMVVRHRDLQVIVPAIPAWAGRPDLRRVLVELLTALSLSPQVGAAMRDRLYRLVDSSGNQDILRTVAEVCGGEFADAYPNVALTRLRRLAGRNVAGAGDLVVSVLGLLWHRPAVRGAVFRHVTDWIRDGAEPRAEVGRRALAALDAAGTGDGRTVLEFAVDGAPESREALARAVGHILANDLDGVLTEMFHRWMSVCARDAALREHLMGLFTMAVLTGDAVAPRVAKARSLAYEWHPVATQRSDPARTELRERLIEQLHWADPMVSWRVRSAAEGRDHDDAAYVDEVLR